MTNNCWIKQSTADYKWTYISAVEAFNLELSCLKRLQGIKNFPEVYSYNESDLTISMKHCGYSIRYFKKHNIKINLPDIEEQVDNIVNNLKKHDIVYVDMNSSGKNICYDDNQIYLIDYDYCILDNIIVNSNFEKLYQYWIDQNEYIGLKQAMLSIFETTL